MSARYTVETIPTREGWEMVVDHDDGEVVAMFAPGFSDLARENTDRLNIRALAAGTEEVA